MLQTHAYYDFPGIGSLHLILYKFIKFVNRDLNVHSSHQPRKSIPGGREITLFSGMSMSISKPEECFGWKR